MELEPRQVILKAPVNILLQPVESFLWLEDSELQDQHQYYSCGQEEDLEAVLEDRAYEAELHMMSRDDMIMIWCQTDEHVVAEENQPLPEIKLVMRSFKTGEV